MNKYIVPVCNIPESKIYNLVINANSYSVCQDKIMEKLAEYSECSDYNEFIDDLDRKDILVGRIFDIEEL